jgi:hypothetical protein
VVGEAGMAEVIRTMTTMAEIMATMVETMTTILEPKASGRCRQVLTGLLQSL